MTLSAIIANLVHFEAPHQVTLERGLILQYVPANHDLIDTPPDVYTLKVFRPKVPPSDKELAIVRSCILDAHRTHPNALAYKLSTWHEEARGQYYGARMWWRQWPIRDYMYAPANIRRDLAEALAKRD